MKFRTGALAWKHEIKRKRISGKYFTFLFESHNLKNSISNTLELVISTSNENKAQQAYHLFISALTLLEASTVFHTTDLPTVVPYNYREMTPETDPFRKNILQFSTSGIYTAAKIAGKASFRKIYKNSLLKYLLACNLHSNYLMQLTNEYVKLPRDPLHHLRYSYTILIFYSIIEELEIEIRASQKNPSKINKRWNPTVQKNIEERLLKKKIDLSKKALWMLRSKPTKVHHKDQLKLAGKLLQVMYNARDSEIEIIDAIAYLSWLRSKIIAHKLNDKFLSISIYDVANANF